MIGSYKIRRADASDADGIAQAHIDSIDSIGPRFYPPASVAAWRFGLTPAVYVDAMKRGEEFFVAVGAIERATGVLGFSTHRVDGARHGTAVYVRGIAARRGVGTALFERAQQAAIASGALSLDIEASLAGEPFFTAQGFAEIGRGEVRWRSGEPIAIVYMRKPLRAT